MKRGNYNTLRMMAETLTFSETEGVKQYCKEQEESSKERADYDFDKIYKILFKYYQNHLLGYGEKDFWCSRYRWYDLSKEEIEENDLLDLKMLLEDLKNYYEFCTIFKNQAKSCKDCYNGLNHYALMLYGAYLEQEEKKKGG